MSTLYVISIVNQAAMDRLMGEFRAQNVGSRRYTTRGLTVFTGDDRIVDIVATTFWGQDDTFMIQQVKR